MKRFSLFSLAAVLLIALVWIGCGRDQGPVAPQTSRLSKPAADAPVFSPDLSDLVPSRHIVVLKAGVSPGEVLRTHGLAADHVYEAALNGFAAVIPAAQLARIKADSRVSYVEADRVVTAFGKPAPPPPPPQTLPTGVDRIDADLSTVTANADVAIIDTGIDLSHPDLNVVSNVSFVFRARTGNDDNGHGTHVAGIVAAKNNGIGVVGVAPGARLWAVKVLNKQGNGYVSDVIKGVDYVTANASAVEVANMSLGGGDSQALNDAITRSADAGVVYAVAAGNEGVDAANTSPANCPNVLAVSAIVDTDGKGGGSGSGTSYGSDDSFASFSNYGAVVDIAAPGVNIYSTYKGGGYATLSGTSMASPHVAGAAALYLTTHPKPIDGLGANAVRDAVVAAGWTQGDPNGFTGDRDASPEPLVKASAF